MTVLAEKLAWRKDLVAKIGKLDDEIGDALIYDDEGTPEETDAARAEAERAYATGIAALTASLDSLQEVENLIRAKNAKTMVYFAGDTYTLSEAIVLRDRLKTESNALAKIAASADEAVGRKRSKYDYERRKKDEVRTFTAVPTKTLRDESDRVARQLRLLDVEIQKVNWSTEI